MMANRMISPRMMAPNINMGMNSMSGPPIPQQGPGMQPQQMPNQGMQQPITSNTGSGPPSTRPMSTQIVRRPGSGKPSQHFSQQGAVMSGQQIMRHPSNMPNQGNPARPQVNPRILLKFFYTYVFDSSKFSSHVLVLTV